MRHGSPERIEGSAPMGAAIEPAHGQAVLPEVVNPPAGSLPPDPEMIESFGQEQADLRAPWGPERHFGIMAVHPVYRWPEEVHFKGILPDVKAKAREILASLGEGWTVKAHTDGQVIYSEEWRDNAEVGGTSLDDQQITAIRGLVSQLIREGCLNSVGSCNCGMFAEEMEAREIVPSARAFYGAFLGQDGEAIDDDHAWAYLPDGTIIDATVDQFQERIGDETHPGTDDIAIVPPGHPFYRHYDTSGML